MRFARSCCASDCPHLCLPGAPFLTLSCFRLRFFFCRSPERSWLHCKPFVGRPLVFRVPLVPARGLRATDALLDGFTFVIVVALQGIPEAGSAAATRLVPFCWSSLSPPTDALAPPHKLSPAGAKDALAFCLFSPLEWLHCLRALSPRKAHWAALSQGRPAALAPTREPFAVRRCRRHGGASGALYCPRALWPTFPRCLPAPLPLVVVFGDSAAPV